MCAAIPMLPSRLWSSRIFSAGSAFAKPGQWNPDNLTATAGVSNLDARDFETCLGTDKYKGAVEEDVNAATELGIVGAPTFVSNGIFVSGAQPAEVFQKIIDEELAALGRERTAPPAASRSPSPPPPQSQKP